jgi:hypothetical protein
MRGQEKKQTSMLVLRSPEDFVPKQHPIRRIKKMADEILQSLSPALEAMYAEGGRPSILPERLLKATILMALYTVRLPVSWSELRTTWSGSPSFYPSLSRRRPAIWEGSAARSHRRWR